MNPNRSVLGRRISRMRANVRYMAEAPLLDAFDFAGVVSGDYQFSHPMNVCGDALRLIRNSIRCLYEGFSCLRINAATCGVRALNFIVENRRKIARIGSMNLNRANRVGQRAGFVPHAESSVFVAGSPFGDCAASRHRSLILPANRKASKESES